VCAGGCYTVERLKQENRRVKEEPQLKGRSVMVNCQEGSGVPVGGGRTLVNGRKWWCKLKKR